MRTGMVEDRYLVEYWPSVKGRAQVVVPPNDAYTFQLRWKGIQTMPIPTVGLNVSQIAIICASAWNVNIDGKMVKVDNDGVVKDGWRLTFIHIPNDISIKTIESITFVNASSSGTIVPTSMRSHAFVPIYSPEELLQEPFVVKTNRYLILNVPNIEFVDVVPYECSVHSCNNFGCSTGKSAFVGPPKPFLLSQVNINWVTADQIDVQVNRHADDGAFVDEMKLMWVQKLSDLQLQRISAERLPARQWLLQTE